MKLPKTLFETMERDPRWAQGPFANVQALPPKQKGQRFELLIKAILIELGENIRPRTDSSHDMIYRDMKAELKGSCVTNKTNDCFSFLQIRPLQEYDVLLLATFSFDGTVQIFAIPKKQVIKYIDTGLFKKQHEGKSSLGSTYLYNGNTLPFMDYLIHTVKIECE